MANWYVNEAVTVPRPVVTVAPSAPLAETLHLMRQHHIHHVIVTEGSQAIGMTSDRDIMEKGMNLNATLNPTATVKDVMVRVDEPLTESMSLSEALGLLQRQKVSALPIVREQTIQGIITESDFLQIFARILEDEEAEAGRPGYGQIIMSHPLVQNALKILDSAGI